MPLDKSGMRPLRSRMQVVFQDPFGSLSPRLTVGEIISTGQTVELISQNGSILDGNGGGVLNVTAATLMARAALGIALDAAVSNLDLSTDA